MTINFLATVKSLMTGETIIKNAIKYLSKYIWENVCYGNRYEYQKPEHSLSTRGYSLYSINWINSKENH